MVHQSGGSDHRDNSGRWKNDPTHPESSDLSDKLRFQEGVTASGRRRIVTVYRGIIFRCYPAKSPYFFGKVHGRYTSLHRTIWEFEVEPVPEDCDIHHLDEDPQNNLLSNLECVAHGRHTAIHNPRPRPKLRGFTCMVCRKRFARSTYRASSTCSIRCANKWQRSKGNHVIYDFDCPVCGIHFRRPRPTAIYCSRKCAASVIHRHRQLPEKPCGHCGRQFRPYCSRVRFCCRSCSVSGVHASRKAACLQPSR